MGIKTGGDLGGVKFISINIILKLKAKIKIPNQNLKELISIKIVLVKGTPKGKSLIKLYKTKQNLVYCNLNLKGFEFEYKMYIKPKTIKISPC